MRREYRYCKCGTVRVIIPRFPPPASALLNYRTSTSTVQYSDTSSSTCGRQANGLGLGLLVRRASSVVSLQAGGSYRLQYSTRLLVLYEYRAVRVNNAYSYEYEYSTFTERVRVRYRYCTSTSSGFSF